MTRKPDPVPTEEVGSEPQVAPAAGQHPHILPTTGGSFILRDGVLIPDPQATPAPNPDPEV